MSVIDPSPNWALPMRVPPLSHTLLTQSWPWGKCYVVSSAIWHIMQTEGPIIPWFRKFSQVRIQHLIISQKKRVIFSQIPWFHSLTHRFSKARLPDPLAKLVASLMPKWPRGLYPHRILSTLSLRSIFLSSRSWIKSLTSSPKLHYENHYANFHYLKGLSPSLFS